MNIPTVRSVLLGTLSTSALGVETPAVIVKLASIFPITSAQNPGSMWYVKSYLTLNKYKMVLNKNLLVHFPECSITFLRLLLMFYDELLEMWEFPFFR